MTDNRRYSSIIVDIDGAAADAKPQDDACGRLPEVALLTDGGLSGGFHGSVIEQVSPEAIKGGPIALAEDQDTITLDAEMRRTNVEPSDDDFRHGRVVRVFV